MLLRLLKRDLKLHWDALVVPLLLLVLMMGVIGTVNQGVAVVGLILMGTIFIPFLPMAIHVREVTQGTLGDVLSLPVSRRATVSLRYLEVLLLAAITIVLVHLGAWVAMSLAAHKALPLLVMNKEEPLGISLWLLFCFAYPMPFALRWDGKGILAAITIFVLFNVGHGLLWENFQKTMEQGPSLFRIVMHLSGHPGHLALVFLALFSLSFLLSLKAFAGRDF